MDQKQRNKLLVAIKKYIVAKFDYGEWQSLAYVTNGSEIIDEHPRLLRSLSFGDEDYEGYILPVIGKLIDSNPANLQNILDYIDLPSYLKDEHPKDYEELYGYRHSMLDATEKIAIANSFELQNYIVRINGAIESDPELAIGTMKELLESIFKAILEAYGETVGKEDFPALLNRTLKVLKLHSKEMDESAKGADIIKRILSSLGQVATGINELRGLYGSGHGRVRSSGITPRHARLVVGAGATLATFLMETFEYHQNKDNDNK